MQDLRRNDFSFDEIDRYQFNNSNGIFGERNNNSNMSMNSSGSNNTPSSGLRIRNQNNKTSVLRANEEEYVSPEKTSSVEINSFQDNDDVQSITKINLDKSNSCTEARRKNEEESLHERQYLETADVPLVEFQSSNSELEGEREGGGVDHEEESNRERSGEEETSTDIIQAIAQSISVLMSIASLSVLMLLFVISKAILGMIVEFTGLLPVVILLLSFVVVSAKYMDLPLAAFVRTLLL